MLGEWLRYARASYKEALLWTELLRRYSEAVFTAGEEHLSRVPEGESEPLARSATEILLPPLPDKQIMAVEEKLDPIQQRHQGICWCERPV
jgi:hypothetical protein